MSERVHTFHVLGGKSAVSSARFALDKSNVDSKAFSSLDLKYCSANRGSMQTLIFLIMQRNETTDDLTARFITKDL